jgi:hypothetical protein
MNWLLFIEESIDDGVEAMAERQVHSDPYEQDTERLGAERVETRAK